MIKKILTWYYGLFCLLVAGAGCLLIQPVWMDSCLTALIGSRWGIRLATDNAHLKNVSTIHFDRLRFVSKEEGVLATFSDGTIRSGPAFFMGNTIQARFNFVVLHDTLFKRLPGIFSPIGHLTRRTLQAEPVRIFARRQGSKVFVHLEPIRCRQVRLCAGALFEKGRMQKAHGVVFVSHKPRTRLLKDLFARMTPQKDGSRKIRLVFFEKKLALYGKPGLLFEADWQTAK